MPAKRSPRTRNQPSNAYGLPERQWHFCQQYVIDDNGAQAAIRAGYAKSGAKVQAARMLTNVNVKRAIAELRAERAKRLEITADDVVRHWIHLVMADPNELIELRRICCRHCHGLEFKYQRTAGEMKHDQAGWEVRSHQAMATGQTATPFDPMGGEGYDARKMPHKDCPECFGEGLPVAFPKDTRNLSEGARRLLASVKVTKDGIEIKMHDPTAALLNIAKHLGLFTTKADRGESGGGGAIPITIIEFVRTAEPAHGVAGARPLETAGIERA